jgi:hypothetical protein
VQLALPIESVSSPQRRGSSVSTLPSNEPLVRCLQDAVSAAAGLAVLVDSTEIAPVGRAAYTHRIRMIRQALEWAICDLSVPQIEARTEKAA